MELRLPCTVTTATGQTAWDWIDPRLKTFLAWFRKEIGREVYVNNWDSGGKLSQRGMRCNLCSLVKDKTLKGLGYNSAHIRFQALDFNVKGMEDKDAIKWLVAQRKPAGTNPCRVRNGRMDPRRRLYGRQRGKTGDV